MTKSDMVARDPTSWVSSSVVAWHNSIMLLLRREPKEGGDDRAGACRNGWW